MATGSEQPEQTAEEHAAAKARYEALLESADPFVVALRLMVGSWGALTLCAAAATLLFFYQVLFGEVVWAILAYWLVAEGSIGSISFKIVCKIRDWDRWEKENEAAYAFVTQDWNKFGRKLVLGFVAAAIFFYTFKSFLDVGRSTLGNTILLVTLTALATWIAHFRAPREVMQLDRIDRDDPSPPKTIRIGAPVWRVTLVLLFASLLLAQFYWLWAFGVVEHGEFSPPEILSRLMSAAGAVLLGYAGLVAATLSMRAHFRAVFGAESGRK